MRRPNCSRKCIAIPGTCHCHLTDKRTSQPQLRLCNFKQEDQQDYSDEISLTSLEKQTTFIARSKSDWQRRPRPSMCGCLRPSLLQPGKETGKPVASCSQQQEVGTPAPRWPVAGFCHHPEWAFRIQPTDTLISPSRVWGQSIQLSQTGFLNDRE